MTPQAQAALDLEQITLIDSPCKCGGTTFNLSESGPHLRADCAACGTFRKFVSRRVAESPRRSLADRPWVSVAQRGRVMARGNYVCVACGKGASDGVRLVVAHLIDREKAFNAGLYDPIIDSEYNMVCACEACNSGMRFSPPSIALMIRCLKIWEANRDG